MCVCVSQLSGELRVRGPALSTYTAPLHVPYLPRNSFTDPAKHVAWLKQAAAAARARQLLGLTELQAEVRESSVRMCMYVMFVTAVAS